MPEVQTQQGEHPRTFARLKPGEKVAFCRCFGSKQFPFCDGTHREHKGRGPLIVEVVSDKEG